QEAHRPGEEGTVRPDPEAEPRRDGQHPLGRLPVGGEVVLAAQPVVVDAGRVRDGGVYFGRLVAARENSAEPGPCHRAPLHVRIRTSVRRRTTPSLPRASPSLDRAATAVAGPVPARSV